jgi:5-methyltetrahydropteroyltriglutamate--homocysteine methyltransferase
MHAIPTSPAILTTVVGSYPIPSWLAAYPTHANLRDAILVVLKTQELAGIDVISDGELSRFDVNHPETNGMIDYFVRPLEGFDARMTRAEIDEFRKRPGMEFRTQWPGVVRGRLSEGALHLPADYASVRELTAKPLKFTVTSPYMLAKTVLNGHYRDLQTLVMDLAGILRKQVSAIDAPVVQVDEANLPGSPQDGALAATAINHVLQAAKGRKAVHLCFGNYGGQTIQKGHFKDLLPFFNALDCDHLVLELARPGYDKLEVLRDLKAGIALGVGVIDIKDNQVEAADEVARRIELSVKTLGPERIRWVHPDCGFWMLPRSVADGKMRALVEGRDLYCGAAR